MFSKGGFPQERSRKPFRSPCTHSHKTYRTVRRGGFNGTKDHSKTKAQLTPSCDSLKCSCLPLSHNISNALQKSSHFNWTTLPDFIYTKGELKTTIYVCVFSPLWGVYVSLRVRPLPSRDALFNMLLWYLCLLKGLCFLLTPCRIGPPLPPVVELGTRVGPAGTGPHITWESLTAGEGKEVMCITFEVSTQTYFSTFLPRHH